MLGLLTHSLMYFPPYYVTFQVVHEDLASCPCRSPRENRYITQASLLTLSLEYLQLKAGTTSTQQIANMSSRKENHLMAETF